MASMSCPPRNLSVKKACGARAFPSLFVVKMRAGWHHPSRTPLLALWTILTWCRVSSFDQSCCIISVRHFIIFGSGFGSCTLWWGEGQAEEQPDMPSVQRQQTGRRIMANERMRDENRSMQAGGWRLGGDPHRWAELRCWSKFSIRRFYLLRCINREFFSCI